MTPVITDERAIRHLSRIVWTAAAEIVGERRNREAGTVDAGFSGSAADGNSSPTNRRAAS